MVSIETIISYDNTNEEAGLPTGTHPETYKNLFHRLRSVRLLTIEYNTISYFDLL